MRAMILAAGLGTRLRPLTETVPKPLIDVAGRPMIAYPLLQLRAAGIEEVVVNVHHLAPLVRRELGDGSRFGVRIVYSEEPVLLDTGGGIRKAARWLAGETFLVLNADSIHDVPLRELLAFHRARGALATLVLRPDPDAARYGLIEIDAARRVRRFLGEPSGCGEPLRALMFAGVSAIEPRLLDDIPPGASSLTRDVLARRVRAGEPLFGYVYEGYWRALDTPEQLAAGRREIEAARGLSYLPKESP